MQFRGGELVTLGDYQDIAKGAQRFCELLSTQRGCHKGAEGLVGAEDLQEWQRIVANNDDQVFHRRLTKLSNSAKALEQIKARSKHDPSSGEWVTQFQQIIDLAEEITTDEFEQAIEAESMLDKPPAFWEFLYPFAHWAMSSIRTNAINLGSLLSAKAELELTFSLLEILSWLSAKTLALELNLSRVRNQLSGLDSAARYQHFVHDYLLDPAYRLALFSKYPILARLLVVVSKNWVDAQGELLNRFSTDRAQLSAHFFFGQELGCIEGIQPLSDPHAGFRSVFVLSLSSHRRVIYKPRFIDIEEVFQQLLRWFNERGFEPQFKPIRTLPKMGYGWVEHIDHLPCDTHQEVERFFCRQGANLCLMYLLGATDLHFENLIAHGEHPVIIDLETLFCPEPQNDLLVPDFDSVLRSGFLPTFTFGDRGMKGFDSSGLGGQPGQRIPVKRKCWSDYQTDKMRLTDKYLLSEQEVFHLPRLGESLYRADSFVEQVLYGFKQMFHFIQEHRVALLSDDGPLTLFQKCPTRLIVRATDSYFELLNLSLEPRWMKSGLKREIILESLWRNSFGQIQELFAQSEIDDLWFGDIPLFVTTPSNATVNDSRGNYIVDLGGTSGYKSVVNRLGALASRDCAFQCRLIEATLEVKGQEVALGGELSVLVTEEETNDEEFENRVGIETDLIAAAIEIGDKLIAESIDFRNGKRWVGLEYNISAQQYYLTLLNTDLYNGSAGIALFFSSLFATTRENRFRDTALLALAPCLEIWLDRDYVSKGFACKQWLPGGFSGMGGSIYTLAKIGSLLENDRFFDHALTLASYINSPSILADSEYDIISGVAGYLLGLITLYQYTKEDYVLEQAIGCGNSLVKSQSAASPFCWKQPWTPLPLTGMAHGASGIASALFRLNELSNDARFVASARCAVDYERLCFSKEEGNWPDLRRKEGRREFQPSSNCEYMTAWCHGATGIGYARLAILQARHDASLQDDLEIAIATTKRNLYDGQDHLCCGLFGRLDFLFESARWRGDELALKTVWRAAANAVARTRERGHWLLGPAPTIDVPIPGFMQGLSGIGTTLLRFANPDTVPNTLLLR